MFGRKMFVGKKYLVKNNFWLKKTFASKKIFGRKYYLIKNILVEINFLLEKIVGKKKVG